MKKFFATLITLLVAVSFVFPMTACTKTVDLKITVEAYNIEDSETTTEVLTFKLYENYAPNAVKQIKNLVNDGYYDNTFFYKQSKSNGTSISSQIMLGELKLVDNKIVRQDAVSISDAEFVKNGVQGSKLVNEKGSIGLWRTWDSTKTYSVNGFENSISTLFMPTSTLTSYNDYFCVLGKVASDDDSDVLANIMSLLADSTYYVSYTAYYSADKDGNMIKDADNNPIWNIALTDDFDDGVEKGDILYYEASSDPANKNITKIDTSFDSYTVITSANYLKITSVKVK